MRLTLEASYAQLPDVLYSMMPPVPVAKPELLYYNSALAARLGLEQQPDFGTTARILGGNDVPDNATPLAMAYAGHQYGHFTMLGDGRAILLGEMIAPDATRYDIHLKGSGQTPYSRRGDGRATLASVIREYIMSHAMHALGIPTTHSLAIIATGEVVHRDKPHAGAVLTRVGRCHIRVGTFEYVAAKRDNDALRALVDYCCQRYFPSATTALGFLNAVITAQSELIAQWMAAGFIHGVMNTDNMLINGDTIDYGPCAFMDTYHPDTVFSSIDQHGRYAYSNQPIVALWNLTRLAETLVPLLHDDNSVAITIAEDALAQFQPRFEAAYLTLMRGKLGLSDARAGDDALVQGLLTLMHRHELDYSNTFRALSVGDVPNALRPWHATWQHRVGNASAAQQRMLRANPAVIPRLHLVEKAIIMAEQGDWTIFEALYSALGQPYQTPQEAHFMHPPTPSERVYQTFCGT